MSSQNKKHVKTGDLVVVVSGKNNYRNAKKNGNIKAIGKVLQTSPKEGKVIVEGVNMVKKHVKPRKQARPAVSSRQRRHVRVEGHALLPQVPERRQSVAQGVGDGRKDPRLQDTRLRRDTLTGG